MQDPHVPPEAAAAEAPLAADATEAAGTLTPIQARVLGALVEKESTTPDAYPLSANAVLLACNQKTSRDPVLELEPGAVGHALRELEARRMVSSVHGARVQRYEHRMARTWSLTTQQQALLAMLLLRGPQTASELLVRCERMARFEDVQQVRDTLERLAQRQPPLAVLLGRDGGQREDRYMHLLCGPVQPGIRHHAASASVRETRASSLEARVESLEAAVARLQAELAQRAGD
ncbi:MAG TPA: DUF480 domain-containing protein [Luteimonas sp.]|nr:DUF480 domain-containing protein [Luteimonas sp.]